MAVGSTRGNPGIATCSTVIKNSSGGWMVECVRSLGSAINFVAELSSIRDGLLMAHNLNLWPVIVETNSMTTSLLY